MENAKATKYLIKARIDLESAKRAGVDNTDGYSVYDYFNRDIDGVYPTQDMAALVAQSGYKGPDVDGVGCTWEIIPADPDTTES